MGSTQTSNQPILIEKPFRAQSGQCQCEPTKSIDDQISSSLFYHSTAQTHHHLHQNSKNPTFFDHLTSNASTSSNFLKFIFLLLISHLSVTQVEGSALSTTVAAGEKLCFYTWVDKPNEKVGFYFAVQSGGDFDIDWTVTDPKDNIILEGEKERQADYIFTGAEVGEYSFCFNNDMSSFSEKLVDFDIMVEHEPRAVAPAKPTSIADQTSSLEDSIYKLSGSLSNIQRTQKYFRTRENRNFSTVQTTQNRIFYFNIAASLLLVGMSLTQVFVVRKFFNSPGKYVRV